jgi:hypothetical protein
MGGKPPQEGVGTMAKKKSTKKAPRAKKSTKPVVQADDSQELVVFAFRLTRAERDLIHQAAGPAKASKLARSLLVAAAQKDAKAVKAIMETVQAEA